jgi:hypothetical protein
LIKSVAYVLRYQGAACTHLFDTTNETPLTLIDGSPPYFNNKTESDVTDHSNGSDFYEYDDMPALCDV